MLAPCSTHSATWSAISVGCVGRYGLCSYVAIPPVGATVMMTLRGVTCAVLVLGMACPSSVGARGPAAARPTGAAGHSPGTQRQSAMTK
jgi:hypothetical protein